MQPMVHLSSVYVVSAVYVVLVVLLSMLSMFGCVVCESFLFRHIVSVVVDLHNLGRLGLDSAGITRFTGRNAVDRVVLGDRLRLGRCIPGLASQDLSVSSDQKQRQDHENRETAEEG